MTAHVARRYALLKQITWGQLNSEVGLLSEFLEQMPALQRGDRLGVLGSNCATYIQVQSWLKRSVSEWSQFLVGHRVVFDFERIWIHSSKYLQDRP